MQFPEGWDVWYTENHWSNEDSIKRYIKKVVIPFVTQKREALKLETTHPALALFDGFKGQTTEMIHSFLAANNIVTIQLPPNCTDKLQLLDLSFNKPMKDHLKSKFQAWYKAWYTNEVRKQLKTTSVESIKVEVNLAVVKNPSANWIIAAWNELEKRPQIAINGYHKAGILDATDL